MPANAQRLWGDVHMWVRARRGSVYGLQVFAALSKGFGDLMWEFKCVYVCECAFAWDWDR